jgi:hypothetical protein
MENKNTNEVSLVVGNVPSALGVKLDNATLADVRDMLRSFLAWRGHGLVILSDILVYAKRKGWEREVEEMLGQLEFDMADVTKALAVGEVPQGLRHPDLNQEHYFVVSHMGYDDQMLWLDRAVKNKMTGLVLKRSIEAGKVLSKEQIEMLSGANSGILNYHGILTHWQRWERKVGGEEGILSWPADVRKRWVDDVTPIAQLCERVVESLK